MPDTGTSIAAEQDSSQEGTPQGLVDANAASASSEISSSDAETWHEHVRTHQAALHDEMVEAREVLHMGTASEAVELANRSVSQEAHEAAARWQAGTHA